MISEWMNKNKMLAYAFPGIVVAILITILSGNFFVGLIVGALVLMLIGNVKTLVDPPKVHDKREFTHYAILLASAVIKADGRIDQQELRIVRQKLVKDFAPAMVNKYMADLNSYMSKKVHIEAVCSKINAEFNVPSKIQLIHFLSGIAVSNGILTQYEYQLLYKIARHIELPQKSFNAILAMFNYQHEGAQHKNYSNSGHRSTVSTSSKLSLAYQILEIDKSATNDAIKKAYRKLAKMHHPDRVSHLGEAFQKSAKNKFLKISEAYELIKEHKGFS